MGPARARQRPVKGARHWGEKCMLLLGSTVPGIGLCKFHNNPVRSHCDQPTWGNPRPKAEESEPGVAECKCQSQAQL